MTEKLKEILLKEFAEFLKKIELKYTEFSEALLIITTQRKVTLEDEIEILQGKKDEILNEQKKLVTETKRLKEAKDKEKSELEGILNRQKNTIGLIQEQEKQLTDMRTKETELNKKEEDLVEKGRMLKAKELTLNERERTVKKIYNQLDS